MDFGVFMRNITLTGGVAPARAYIEELLPGVFGGRIEPGRVFDAPSASMACRTATARWLPARRSRRSSVPERAALASARHGASLPPAGRQDAAGAPVTPPGSTGRRRKRGS